MTDKGSTFNQVKIVLLIILVIMVTGTSGYILIEDWNIIDAFYMTTITITTVGFSEVNELSSNGKIFTIFLIIISFGTFAFAISNLTYYLLSGNYVKYLSEKKTFKILNKMENHIIICGYGRLGREVVNDLTHKHNPLIIIDKNEDIHANNEAIDNCVFITGNATEEDTLNKAGVTKCKALISCLPNDSDNIYVVLTVRELNRNLNIISRASNHSAVSKLKIAGANHVIMPESIGGSYMASIVSNPDVMSFMELIRAQGVADANIEAIKYDSIPSTFKQKEISYFINHCKSEISIIGLKNSDGSYVINPKLATIFSENMTIFILGNETQIKKLNDFLNLSI
jgi:voltage-gated potassium channel